MGIVSADTANRAIGWDGDGVVKAKDGSVINMGKPLPEGICPMQLGSVDGGRVAVTGDLDLNHRDPLVRGSLRNVKFC